MYGFAIVVFSEEETFDFVPFSWTTIDTCAWPAKIGKPLTVAQAKLRENPKSIPGKNWARVPIRMRYNCIGSLHDVRQKVIELEKYFEAITKVPATGHTTPTRKRSRVNSACSTIETKRRSIEVPAEEIRDKSSPDAKIHETSASVIESSEKSNSKDTCLETSDSIFESREKSNGDETRENANDSTELHEALEITVEIREESRCDNQAPEKLQYVNEVRHKRDNDRAETLVKFKREYRTRAKSRRDTQEQEDSGSTPQPAAQEQNCNTSSDIARQRDIEAINIASNNGEDESNTEFAANDPVFPELYTNLSVLETVPSESTEVPKTQDLSQSVAEDIACVIKTKENNTITPPAVVQIRNGTEVISIIVKTEPSETIPCPVTGPVTHEFSHFESTYNAIIQDLTASDPSDNAEDPCNVTSTTSEGVQDCDSAIEIPGASESDNEDLIQELFELDIHNPAPISPAQIHDQLLLEYQSEYQTFRRKSLDCAYSPSQELFDLLSDSGSEDSNDSSGLCSTAELQPSTDILCNAPMTAECNGRVNNFIPASDAACQELFDLLSDSHITLPEPNMLYRGSLKLEEKNDVEEDISMAIKRLINEKRSFPFPVFTSHATIDTVVNKFAQNPAIVAIGPSTEIENMTPCLNPVTFGDCQINRLVADAHYLIPNTTLNKIHCELADTKAINKKLMKQMMHLQTEVNQMLVRRASAIESPLLQSPLQHEEICSNKHQISQPIYQQSVNYNSFTDYLARVEGYPLVQHPWNC